MPTNPPAELPAPTRTEKAVKSVAKFTGRHSEAVTYAAGVLTGTILVAIAHLLP